MPAPFQFKQFTVQQKRSAMKIGTDGVLLGAWVLLENSPESILDIGTGTGVIALQLAQRSTAETIDAVEIDDEAYEEATENFENSPWSDRLFCYHASIQEFASEIDESYDFIVSNPPFYTESVKTENPSRDRARFEEALPFQHLLVCAAHLLSEKGIFATIIPKKELQNFLALAEQSQLFPKRICEVKGTPTAEAKRVLLEFSKYQQPSQIETLTIELQRHQYTEEYTDLVKEFYLKM